MRVPTAWRANRPPRPQVTGTVGGKAPSGLGKDALLDFKMGVTLDGEPLTEAEIEKLLAASNGLHLVRGRWVEVDREKLSRMLDEFRAVEAAAAKGGCLSAKRCASLPARTCQATSSWTALPSGHMSWPGRGCQRRSPAFAIQARLRNTKTSRHLRSGKFAA